MTLDEGLDLVDLLLRLRQEVAGLARSVAVASPTFTLEWNATIEAIQDRLVTLAFFEQQLAPVLAPSDGERWTLEQYRSWLVQLTHPDAEGLPTPAAARLRTLHPSVH